MTIAGFVAFFVVAVLAPLFLFTPQLARSKREGLANMAPLPLRMLWTLIKRGCEAKGNDEAPLEQLLTQALNIVF